MTTKGKKPAALVLAAIIVLAFLVAVRSTYLTRKIPPPVTHTAAAGESLILNGVSVTVESATLIDGPEISAYMNGYDPGLNYPIESMKMVLVNIHVANESADAASFSWPPFALRSGAWANGFNPNAVRALQPDLPWEIPLVSGQQAVIILPALVTKEALGANNWNAIDRRKYTLDLLQYPDYWRLTVPELRSV